MPGLIAHSINIVEHPELVAERLMHFAESALVATT
jgi:hypothetical protein